MHFPLRVKRKRRTKSLASSLLPFDSDPMLDGRFQQGTQKMVRSLCIRGHLSPTLPYNLASFSCPMQCFLSLIIFSKDCPSRKKSTPAEVAQPSSDRGTHLKDRNVCFGWCRVRRAVGKEPSWRHQRQGLGPSSATYALVPLQAGTQLLGLSGKDNIIYFTSLWLKINQKST